eukprot:1347887-Karenia_brevis.AAC.1
MQPSAFLKIISGDKVRKSKHVIRQKGIMDPKYLVAVGGGEAKQGGRVIKKGEEGEEGEGNLGP